MYDPNKMPDKFAKWPREARVEHLSYRFLKTPFTKDVHDLLEHLYWPAGLEPEGEGCFILGDTGVGKTTAVRMFTNDKYAELRAADPSGTWYRPKVFGTDLAPICHKTPEGLRRPIAVVWVDPRPRFNSFMKDTALGLQVDLGSRFDFGHACIEIARALEEQEVKMIIFDDVQHIVENNMNVYGAADVFKVFAKARVQVICIGLPKAEDLGTENEQLERLVANTYTVLPLRCSVNDFPRIDDNGKAIGRELQQLTPFRRLMKALDRRDGKNSVLPFDDESNLSAPDMALRIHQAYRGYTGQMMKLVMRAAKLAIEDGTSRITRKHFEDAYRKASRCSDEANWFRMPFSQVQDLFGSVVAKRPGEGDGEEGLAEDRPPPKPRGGQGKAKAKKLPMSDDDRRRVDDAFAGRRT